ncbi:MAG: hypothetical protein P1P93_01310 [Gammaproteobacteria bacterium]|nr:hypothetical protein [Gammaproteobacteria bacterium]
MATPLRLKACGLSEIDYTSLKSMLGLAHSLLNHPWILVDDTDADLTVFSLETEQGQAAWQQHQTGFTGILTTDINLKQEADIILKKPLRTKNFSDSLNSIESKKKLSEPAQAITKIADKKPPKQEKLQKESKPSFFSALSKKLAGNKEPASDLPSLTLYLPETRDPSPDTILEPNLLKQWLDDLPENDVDKITTAILGHIVPLNRSKLDSDTRLALLDIYRLPINKLIFNRDISAINKEIHSPAEFLRSIKALSQLLDELAIGYKIIINDKYQQGERPNSHDAFLVAIIRASEMLALLIVHAYRYYRSAPTNSLHELHQLYIYCEASNTTTKTINSKLFNAPVPFHHYYCQIILTGISDPYSLPKYEVFRLFKLMDSMADKVIISPLSEKQKQSPAGFLARGSFCVDCSGDQLPIALNKAADKLRASGLTRVFSTHIVLETIEKIFNHYATTNRGGYDLDFKLLKKIIPQINSSYERKYQRLPIAKHRPINMSYGVSSTYTYLQHQDSNHIVEWHLINEGTLGMMVSRDSNSLRRLSIDELVGLFEPDQPVQLAIIRWLHTDNNKTTLLGLEIFNGEPVAVTFTADGDPLILYGLLLTGNTNTKPVVMTMIVEKGVYSKNRVLRVKQNHHTFVIKTDELIVNGFNYEQFSYNVLTEN